MALNLNSLRIFATAARNENFLKAGKDLNLSQGAVSQRIKQLELELGLPLFEREPRGVSLTKAGVELAQTVETSLGMIDETTKRIRRFEHEVTIQVSPSIARKWLTPRLPAFTELNSDVHLSIEASAAALTRPLHHNEIAMRHGRSFPEVKGQEMRRLVELNLVAVCNPELPGVGVQPSLAHIIGLPLIQDMHRRWDKTLQRHVSSATSKPLIFNSTSLAIDAAMNKQGIAIAPSIFVQDYIAAGRLREIWSDAEPSGEYIFLLWHKQKDKHRPLIDVVKWIHREFGQDFQSAPLPTNATG